MAPLGKLFRGFGFAIQGIGRALITQQNLRIHLVAAVVVGFFGVLARLSAIHWCVVCLCCMLVISLELINTGLEALCDRVEPKQDERIRTAKDSAAGAVLVAAAGSLLIAGLILFGDPPYYRNIAETLQTHPWICRCIPLGILAAILFVFLPTELQLRKRK